MGASIYARIAIIAVLTLWSRVNIPWWMMAGRIKIGRRVEKPLKE